MSLKYIRDLHGVPARRGGKVTVNGKAGVITGASGPHVQIRLADRGYSMPYHPTDDAIVYIDSSGEVAS